MNAPQDAAALKKAAFEANKLAKRLHRQLGAAIADFNMIEAGDKVMVCVSGGKDSYALLDLLIGRQQRSPVPYELVAVNLDQKQPGFPADVLPEYLARVGVPFHIENQDTYSVVKRLVPEGRTMCSLCSRLRRGILYRVASELGANKIALGHHRDDMVVTLMMNMFFGGRMKGMPPKLVSDDGRHVVIRPLAYVAEADLERWAAATRIPDHSLHPVRQPGQPATGADQGADPRMGAQVPGPHRQPVQCHEPDHALAPDGPQPVPVHHAAGHRCGRPGRRQGLRRRRGLRQPARASRDADARLSSRSGGSAAVND